MTVCIGALFRWNYDHSGQSEQWATVALAVSDRMITAGDIEYEPNQKKVAYLTPHIILLIAGDYTVHSQAVKTVMAQIKGRVNITPFDAATMYGVAIQGIQRKTAEDFYMAPLGLNTDGFLAQQKDLAPHFVDTITNQMQSHKGADVSALVMGVANDAAHLYEVDRYGTVNCHDDIGFAAIGIGGTHANSTFMQAGYTNMWRFPAVLSVAYAAKKAAETAPGVGKATDIHIVYRTGTENLRSDIAEIMPAIYKEYADGRTALAIAAIRRTEEAMRVKYPPEAKDDTVATTSEGNSGTEGCGASESPENSTEGSGDVQRQKP